MDDATRRDVEALTGCITGALTREEYETGFAGLAEVDVRETHRVRDAAASAIVRAPKPNPDICGTRAQAEGCEPAAKNDCCDGTATLAGGCGCEAS